MEVCAECGSNKIQAKAWVEINSGNFIEWSDGDDDIWCTVCESIVTSEMFNEEEVNHNEI